MATPNWAVRNSHLLHCTTPALRPVPPSICEEAQHRSSCQQALVRQPRQDLGGWLGSHSSPWEDKGSFSVALCSPLLLHLALCQSTVVCVCIPTPSSFRHVLRNCSSQIPQGAFPVLHSPLTAVTNPAQAATRAHTAAEGHEPTLVFIPSFQTFRGQSASNKSICTPATKLQA